MTQFMTAHKLFHGLSKGSFFIQLFVNKTLATTLIVKLPSHIKRRKLDISYQRYTHILEINQWKRYILQQKVLDCYR